MIVKYLHGIANSVYFTGSALRVETFYLTQGQRDAELAKLKSRAKTGGLSSSAVEFGIVPIRRHVGSEIGSMWLQELIEADCRGLKVRDTLQVMEDA
jgi:hypothetical protein